MFLIGQYVVYRKDVCKVIDIRKNEINNLDYYVFVPISNSSLKIEVPVNNNFTRELISLDKVEEIIKQIPSIEPLLTNEKSLENKYKVLLSSGTHKDLIQIIKTTYLRNQERINQKKKISSKDDYYFQLAEKFLYTEFSVVLNKTFEETKEYVINKLKETK